MKTKLIILLIGIAFVGCGNQYSENNTFSRSDEVIEVEAGGKSEIDESRIRYEPNEYEEKLFDTILGVDSNIQLQIKYYSLMDKGFIVPMEFEDTDYMHYRDFAGDVKFRIGDKEIYAESIHKELFSEMIDDVEFLPLAYLSRVRFDSYDDVAGELKLGCMVVMIESCYAYFFQVIVDKEGNYRVIEIEEE